MHNLPLKILAARRRVGCVRVWHVAGNRRCAFMWHPTATSGEGRLRWMRRCRNVCDRDSWHHCRDVCLSSTVPEGHFCLAGCRQSSCRGLGLQRALFITHFIFLSLKGATRALQTMPSPRQTSMMPCFLADGKHP
ncbi:unnamed protein product [Ixodes pacificus]